MTTETNRTDWTVESVKAELPEVAVSVARAPREMCRIIGRQGRFATVCYGPARYEFAWQTVADALNFDRALII